MERATETVEEMENEGHNMIPTRQGYLTRTLRRKRSSAAVMGSTPELPLFRHGGNPVLRWMADCVEVMQDPAGTRAAKPDRRKSSKRIDGIAAAVNAMSRAMLRTVPKKKRRSGVSV